MTTVLAAMAGLGAVLLVLAGALRVQRERARVATAVQMPGADDPLAALFGPVASDAVAGPWGAARRPALPRPLAYLEGRMRVAGVDWPPSSIYPLMLGAGFDAALLTWIVTGIWWAAVGALAVGFYAPVWRLNGIAERRARRVMRQLDQVCTELVQATSSGGALYQALVEQARKAPDPTGAELRRVVQRVQDGTPLADAVEEFGARIDLDEARLFATGVRLAQEEGARPVPVLDSVLRSLRSRRELASLIGELSASERKQSMVLMVVPLILIPGMRFAAPGYTGTLFHTFTGQVLIVADIVWMVFGLRVVQGWFGGIRA